MSVICETSQSSIWASQQLLLLTHSTTFVFSVALSVNASASGVAIARRSGWLRIACAELFPVRRPHVTPGCECSILRPSQTIVDVLRGVVESSSTSSGSAGSRSFDSSLRR